MVNQLINLVKIYMVYIHPPVPDIIRWLIMITLNYLDWWKNLICQESKPSFSQEKIDPNLLDIIAYQKDGFGNTTLTLAARLGFQSYLDYCFNTLVVNYTGRTARYSGVRKL